MKKFVLYVFLLSIATAFVSAILGFYPVTKISLLTLILSGFTGVYLVILHSYRFTTRATRRLKVEGMKAFDSISLFYQLEKLGVHQGAKQYTAVSKKSRILLRLIKSRFASNSLTDLRFRQEVEAYVDQITRNLEQVVTHHEALAQMNPNHWRSQIRQLERAGASSDNNMLKELKEQLKTYATLETHCKELLSENSQLLAEMDKAILAMNQQKFQLNTNRNQSLLIGKDAFIHQYLFQ
ncbi:MAG: hypothetical protein AAF992_07885 [Bacteroidota bacterium]